MRTRLGVTLGLLTAAVVLAPGAAAVALEADLRWREPANAEGLVAASPGMQPLVAHFSSLRAPAEGGLQEVARGPHVRITLHHWDRVATVPLGTLGLGIGDESTTYDLHNAVVSVVELADAPQILALQPTSSQGESSQMRLPPTRCLIGGPETDEDVVFADGQVPDHTIGEPAWITSRRGPDRLGASCWAAGATTSRPDRAFFYGMRINVTSDEGTQTIETGTQRDRLPEGWNPPARFMIGPVTQILEVQDLTSAGLWLHQPFHGRIRFFAPEILVAGQLDVGASQGRLAWGDVAQEGELEGFAAGGAFALGAAGSEMVSVRGETLNGPAQAASDSATRLWFGRDALVPVTAAALMGVAVAARLLLAAILRAAPDRVLDHPRRVQIMDFVRSNPGVETATVARTLGLQPVRVRFHALKLRAAGRLVIHRVGGRTALFVAKEGFRGHEDGYALLRRESLRRLFETLAADPGLDQVTLAARLRLTQSQVSRNLRMLTGAGLVDIRVENHRRRYSARAGTPNPSMRMQTPPQARQDEEPHLPLSGPSSKGPAPCLP